MAGNYNTIRKHFDHQIVLKFFKTQFKKIKYKDLRCFQNKIDQW